MPERISSVDKFFLSDKIENKKLILPHKWLTGDNEIISNPLFRAISCIEHLIRNNTFAGSPIKFLEIGPKSICNNKEIQKKHIAPIKLLSKSTTNSFKCLSVGLHIFESDEEREMVLGDVEYLDAILLPNETESDLRLINKLDGQPDIIYGQHVFEDSTCINFEVLGGDGGLFEKAAEILNPGGFIIVDNYGGREAQLGVDMDLPYSSRLRCVTQYVYGNNSEKYSQGIYVFRKPQI